MAGCDAGAAVADNALVLQRFKALLQLHRRQKFVVDIQISGEVRIDCAGDVAGF